MRSLLFTIAAAIALALTPAAASAATINVAETGGSDAAGCGVSPNPDCATVAYAVNSRAADGDTVQLGVGTFPMTTNAVINSKSLSIVGAGIDQTVIDGESATTLSPNGMFRINALGATPRNVSFSGLTFKRLARAGAPPPQDSRFAIFVNNPTYFTNLNVTDVKLIGSGPTSTPDDNLLYVQGNRGNVTLSAIQVVEGSGNAVLLDRQKGDFTLQNSTIAQASGVTDCGVYAYAQSGHDVVGDYTVDGNTFNAACGTLLRTGFFAAPGSFLGDVTFTNNDFQNASSAAISINNVPISPTPSPATVNNVRIADNTMSSSGTGTGVTIGGNIAGSVIEHNSIRGFSSGIALSNAVVATDSPSGTTISANQIVGNRSIPADPLRGITLGSNATGITADSNWWGCNAGPVIGNPLSPLATCDGIQGSASQVTTADWVVLGIDAVPPSTLAYLGAADVTVSLAKLNTGAAAPDVFADGTAIPLTPAMGTLDTATPPLASNLADAEFTSFWRTGRSVSATLDNQTVTQTWTTDSTPLTLHVETPANGGVDNATCGPLPHQPCATLAQAYANSLSGDTIQIGSGTFPQTTCVAIAHDLTIDGAGIGNTILDGQGASGMACDGMLRPTGNGTNISISGLSFKNLAAGPGSGAFAIYVQPNPSLTSVNVDVADIEVDGNAAAKPPTAFSSSNNLGDVSIDHLVWPSANGNAIMLQNHAGSSLVENSTITQPATSVAIFDYSWGGGLKTVTGDHIYRANTINAANGIYVNAGFSYTPSLDPSSYLGDVIFERNTINSTAATTYGIRVANTPRATPSPPNPLTSPATIDHVQFKDNKFTGAASGSGISLQGKVNDAQLDHNSIRGYARGIDLGKSPVFAADFPSNGIVSANQIVDNVTGVRLDAPGYAIPATLDGNWWGCNAGPDVGTAPPDADCDTVDVADASALTLDNWVVLRIDATPATQLGKTANATVTSGFDRLNTGAAADPDVFSDSTVLPMSSTGGTIPTSSPTLTSGLVNIVFTSTGTIGRSASASFDHQSVTHSWTDDLAPVVAITAPTNGLITNATSTTLHFTVTDVDPYTCNRTDGDTISLSEGVNTITVVCTDNMGNAGYDSVSVIRDTTAPVVTIIAPVNGLLTNQSSVTLNYTVVEAYGLQGCTPADGSTVNLNEGVNTISVSCTDTAGNVGQASITVTRDTIPPSVLITSPSDGDTTLADTATVTFSVVDATATNCTPTDGSSAALSYGPNTIVVTCTDAAGNVGSDSVTITRTSNVPPVVTITSPATGTIVNGDSTVLTYNAASQHGSVSCTPPSGTTIPLAIGVNTLTVNCVDSFGNVASASVTVYRPDTLPTCAKNVVITDVKRVGSRTRIRGLARLQYVGQRVGIEYQPTGSKKVASPKVLPDGSFSVVVNRPSSPSYSSNQARYRAVLGSSKTSWIKLTRRMGGSAVTYNGPGSGTLTVTGSVSLPIAKGQPVRVERSDACGNYRQIGTVKMNRDGTFAGTVPTGGGSQAAVNIRIKARVAKSSNPRYRFNTYSIVQPVVVDR